MYTIKEKQRVDRELFSELIESPVNPTFLKMTRPFTVSLNPLFYLWINSEALWEWRPLKNPDEVFDALQCNLRIPATDAIVWACLAFTTWLIMQ